VAITQHKVIEFVGCRMVAGELLVRLLEEVMKQGSSEEIVGRFWLGQLAK
jgi:hypothetical protein